MDGTDRTLLGLLQDDAHLSCAELGRAVHLSPAAVHERVRRLRRDGVIRRTTVDLDAAALGRHLLAFVEVDTEGWVTEPLAEAVGDDPRVEEMHPVAGDTHFLVKVRVGGPGELQDLLRDLYAVPGVRNTRTRVALQTYVERGPSPTTPPPAG